MADGLPLNVRTDGLYQIDPRYPVLSAHPVAIDELRSIVIEAAERGRQDDWGAQAKYDLAVALAALANARNEELGRIAPDVRGVGFRDG